MDLIGRASNMGILQKHIPQLRFPDFLNDGEWEVKRLGEVCRLTNGMAFKPSDWIETGIPIVRIQNLNDENAPFNYCAPEIIDDRCMIDTGTLLFSWSGTPGTSFGAFIWNRGKAVLNQHIFIVKPVEIDKVFLKMAIDANMTSIIEKSHGGAGLRHITKSDFEDIRISVPKDIAEQRRIAACLFALDEMLSATNGKLERLKTYKKGLMQKLFPAKGKKQPELRFKEFEKDGEWEEKKVSEIFHITRGYVLPTSETKNVPDGEYKYPVYSSQTANNGLMGFYNKALFKDAITWTTDGANAGTVRFRNGEFYCTNVCGVLISDVGYANPCIAEIIGSVSKKYVSLVGNPKLMNNVMAEIPILVPSLAEQRKIADCLTSIDEVINLYTNKVTLLELYKKGLMQQLFPTSK